MKDRITIFGGSGFLGSHVADTLTERGYEVVIFDKKLSQWLQKNQEMILGDICKLDEVEKAIKGSKFVYNFAGLSDLNEGANKPLETINLNILGNANILESSRRHKIQRFIYSSSIYVFSDLGSFYRCSKQSAEQYILEYKKKYGLDFTILRYGSLFGPRSDKTNGIFRMIKKSIDRNKVIFTSHVDTSREYIHVSDAAKASADIIEKKEYTNKSLTITGSNLLKSIFMAKKIAELLNLDFEIDSNAETDEYHSSHYIESPMTYKPPVVEKFPIINSKSLELNLIDLIKIIKN